MSSGTFGIFPSITGVVAAGGTIGYDISERSGQERQNGEPSNTDIRVSDILRVNSQEGKTPDPYD